MENVVINFEADLKGFEPLIATLKEVGALTDKQAKDFLDTEKKTQAEREKSTEQIKKQAGELGKMVNNIRNIGEGAAGGAIKQATTNFSKLDTQANKLADTLVELLSSGKGNTEEFKKLVKELYDTEAQIRGVDSGSKKLTTQLRDLKNQLATMDEGSVEFEKLAVQAAKLEDKIGDTSERVRVLASDTFALDATVGVIQGIAGAFSAAQGFAALFGEENEDLQKALLKVNAAIAISVGLQQSLDLLRGQSAAKLGVLKVAEQAYAFAVGQTTGALKAARIALIGLGFGAVIVLIGLLIANWDRLRQIVGITTENIKDQQEALASYNKTVDELNSKINESAALQRRAAEGGINEIRRRIELLQAQGLEEGKIFDLQQLLRKKELQELKIQLEEAKKIRGGAISEQLKLITELGEKIKDKENEIQVATQERLKAVRDQFVETKKPVQELEAEFVKLKNTIEGLPRQIDLTFKPTFVENEIDGFLEKKLQAEMEAEAQRQVQIRDASIQSAQTLNNALFEIDQQYRQAALNEELSKLDRQKEAELKAAGDNAKAREAIEVKYRKKEAELKRKAFIAEKNAKIIEAVIATALAIIKAAPNPVLMALAGVTGATSVATIAAQPIPQFAKGTKNAPEGYALVGEAGPELVHLPKGAKVITHPETQNFLNGVRVSDIISKYNLPKIAQYKSTGTEGRKGFDFDYQRLGSEIAKNGRVSVNIDENGFEMRIKKGMDTKVYMDKRHSIP